MAAAAGALHLAACDSVSMEVAALSVSLAHLGLNLMVGTSAAEAQPLAELFVEEEGLALQDMLSSCEPTLSRLGQMPPGRH